LQWTAHATATAVEHEPISVSHTQQKQPSQASVEFESAAVTTARAAVVQAKQKLDEYSRSNPAANAWGAVKNASTGTVHYVPPAPAARPNPQLGSVGGRTHVPKRYASVDSIFKF